MKGERYSTRMQKNMLVLLNIRKQTKKQQTDNTI